MADRAEYEDEGELEQDLRGSYPSRHEVTHGGRGEGADGSGFGSLNLPAYDGSRGGRWRRGDSRSRQEQRAMVPYLPTDEPNNGVRGGVVQYFQLLNTKIFVLRCRPSLEGLRDY